MKWRDVIIGSIATLVVTILSGVVIYYLTRDAKESPVEKLGYSIQQSASFVSENNRLALVTVTLFNSGNASSEDVVGGIKFAPGAIRDMNVRASAGEVSGFEVTTRNPQGIGFSMPHMLPNEKVTLSFLLESTDLPATLVSLKSSKTIGQEGSALQLPRAAQSELADLLLPSMVPLLIGLLISLLLLMLVRIKLWSQNPASSLNNNGFVLLHKNLPEVASGLLRRAVAKGQDSPHSLSNYGVTLALKGDFSSAEKYISAGEFLARSAHDRAVVAFNRCILDMKRGDAELARLHIQKALSLSRNPIQFYCSRSDLIATMTNDFPEVRRLVKLPAPPGASESSQ